MRGQYVTSFPVSRNIGNDIEEWPLNIKLAIQEAIGEIKASYNIQRVERVSGECIEPLIITNPDCPFTAKVTIETEE